MTPEQIEAALRRANGVALRALAMGRHPFGALLLAPDGETVLAEQGNIDTVNHAESTLARTTAAVDTVLCTRKTFAEQAPTEVLTLLAEDFDEASAVLEISPKASAALPPLFAGAWPHSTRP